MSHFNVFISHSSSDLELTKKLYEYLSHRGISCWLDQYCIPKGMAYPKAIQQGLKNSDMMVLVFSHYVNNSVDVANEIDQIYKTIPIIPFYIDNSEMNDDLRYYLSRKQHIIGFPNPEDKFEELADNIARLLDIELLSDIDNKNEVIDESESEEDFDEKYFDENVKVAQQYEEGDRVAQNYEIAYQQYEVAAKKKNPYAIYKIGQYHQNGWIGEVDHITAMKKYKKAVELGYTGPRLLIGIMYKQGLGVSPNAKKALEWFTAAAEDGEAAAMTQIGNIYLYGCRGIEADYQQAFEWFEKAAEGNDGEAMLQLGLMYKNGAGVDQNDRKASTWFRKSSKAGCAEGHINLGLCYENGEGVEIDLPRALGLYEKAYKQNSSWAMCLMANMYLEGRGTNVNVAKGIALLQEAAELDDYEAIDRLGICYATGMGVDKDLEKAKECFYHSIHLGSTPAIDHLNQYVDASMIDKIMMIEDVFSITGRGIVVTGILLTDLKVGDAVCITDEDRIVTHTVITGIEMFRKILDEGQAGDNVGLLLRNVQANEIGRGMMISFDTTE